MWFSRKSDTRHNLTTQDQVSNLLLADWGLNGRDRSIYEKFGKDQVRVQSNEQKRTILSTWHSSLLLLSIQGHHPGDSPILTFSLHYSVFIIQICCDFSQSGKQVISTLLPPPPVYFLQKRNPRKKDCVYAVFNSYSSIFSMGFVFKVCLLSDFLSPRVPLPLAQASHCPFGSQQPLNWSSAFSSISPYFISNIASGCARVQT